jgi:hypothetical protein
VATWVKCTAPKGEAVYVNLDNAVTISPDKTLTGGASRIVFTGSGGNDVMVKEAPEQILAQGGFRIDRAG